MNRTITPSETRSPLPSVATTGATGLVPLDLDGSRWETLEPLYRTLSGRVPAGRRDLESLVLDRSELDAAAREAFARLFIAKTCRTDDAAAKSAFERYLDDVQPKLKQVAFALDRAIVSSPHRSGLDARRYGVMLRKLAADVEIFREESVPLQTEETKLAHRYDEICGAMTVTFRGEERTLPQMAKLLEQTDRAVREEAWRLVAERRERDRAALDEILDELVALRHRIARNAGFGSYRDYAFRAMHRFDYGPAECTAFHRAAGEVCVPVLRALNRQRAEALRVSPLRPWDLAVDIHGRPPLRPFATADELVEKTSRLFHRMDSELGALFDTMRDGRSLDLESRKGKAPGGYQETLDRVRRPFIFMNATGRQSDLETMIHEAGHAFHSLLGRAEPLLVYRHPPIEFCEVASMGMELLAMPLLDEFYSSADHARAVRGQLEDLASLFPWVATVDAFQHWIYAHPDHDHDARTVAWEELVERFGAAVSWEGLERHRASTWQRQLHIFEVPFYYIEYGIAQLGALQLWTIARKDPARALASYKKALRMAGGHPLPDLFKAAGLVFDFGPETMKRLMDAVQEELAKLPL
jgi:oligoendopeptidase F